MLKRYIIKRSASWHTRNVNIRIHPWLLLTRTSPNSYYQWGTASPLVSNTTNIGARIYDNSFNSTIVFYSISSNGTIHNNNGAYLSVGIRREDKNRWERRVPLVPDEVERLTKEFAVKVYVQPSSKRVIPDNKYEEAGAIIIEDLSHADVILGVKEVPKSKLIPNKTYLFFSHTHKGQSYNMSLLKEIMNKNIRLIDYELMTNENKKRLVLFSKFAGYAGMIDGMHGLGHRLLALGYGTPFLSIGMSYMYRCLADARLDVTRTGQVIMDDGLPPELGPMTFIFTGSNGNVSKGALHVFKCLPHEWVTPDHLKELFTSNNYSRHKVYGCLVNSEDYIVRKDGKPFEKDYYKSNPEEHDSIFHEKIAPYTRVLVNGILWTEKFPRLLTIDQTRHLYKEGRLLILSIYDISCDIRGPLEFMSHATTIDDPFFMYDPSTDKNHDNMEGPGVQIMSIDNLPTEMPLEASEYFSSSLFPHVIQLIQGNFSHPVIKGAMITDGEGQLLPRHKHLEQSIRKHAKFTFGNGAKIVNQSSKVLLLGSGYVARPLIDYLLRDEKTNVTIASNMKREAERLSDGRSQAPVVELSISDKKSLGDLIKRHDVVVSFVPAIFHPTVAEIAIQEKKHMVTASYISPEMAALNERAKSAGITILNELGLDPGIDHLTAMKMFDDIKRERGKLTGFVSWCGGLPAPEASCNPLGYKFSWSPRGVLLAALNSAKYQINGKFIDVHGSKLLESAVDVPIYKGFSLEGIPNRDSLKYRQVYGLSDEVTTLFRGTLRYKGYSLLMSGMRDLGLLDAKENQITQSKGLLWNKFMHTVLGTNNDGGVLAALVQKIGKDRAVAVYDALKWLDCFSTKQYIQPKSSVLDVFCAHLEDKLRYGPGERDMVAMHHVFELINNNGEEEQRTSTLIAYGDPQGYSAMAKTVGLPAAMGTEMILKGQIRQRGVIAPVSKDLYEPLLDKLYAEGIIFKEDTRKL